MAEAIGLTTEQAAARLEAEGPNRLPGPTRVPAWRRLVSEMVHFFALMLWVAGALAIVAGMAQLGLAIFVVIVVNGCFAFAQQQRAERATVALSKLLPAAVLVVRDGEPRNVESTELVRGDLVVLAPGDRVAADLEVVFAVALSIDESMLTGESQPTIASAGATLWAGTFVASGTGRAVVIATGTDTRLAGLSELTGSVERPTSPLARELQRIVRVMATITIAVGLAFFGLSVVLGSPVKDGFLFAIGVTVALVPEGLLPTVTLSLAIGAQRMAGRHALVRHLDAVETLGSTTFICTDKTGTLTRNEMAVVEAWTPSGSVTIAGTGYEPTATVAGTTGALAAAAEMARLGRACSSGRAVLRDGQWCAAGDPMEAAIDAMSRRCPGPGEPELVSLERFAFDPVRRRASVEVGAWLVTKGAPESVLPLCGSDPEAVSAVEELATRGLRVLAIARRPLSEVHPDADAATAESGLELVGLIGLHDPPRAEVADALRRCRAAGIRVAMLTGDHPSTARAIASEVGLLLSESPVLVGSELPKDLAALGEVIDRDGAVISRIDPEDKMRIARALQQRGHVVAMTGDGVNDGPALNEADIGIAMGRSGTDVARQAADLVLLDDNFATIVGAVEYGRATFTNIRRVLTYHLTANVAELTPFLIWALSGGRFPLAIGVLQVLSIDIATDLLPAMALGSEPAGSGLLERPLTGRHVIDRALLARAFLVLGPTEAVIEMLAFLAGLLAAGWAPGRPFPAEAALYSASGAAWSAVVLGQAANAYACRSATRPVWRIPLLSNRMLVVGIGVQLGLLGGLLRVGPIARALGQGPPSLGGFAVAASVVPALVIVDGIHKARHGRRRRRRAQPTLSTPSATTQTAITPIVAK